MPTAGAAVRGQRCCGGPTYLVDGLDDRARGVQRGVPRLRRQYLRCKRSAAADRSTAATAAAQPCTAKARQGPVRVARSWSAQSINAPHRRNVQHAACDRTAVAAAHGVCVEPLDLEVVLDRVDEVRDALDVPDPTAQGNLTNAAPACTTPSRTTIAPPRCSHRGADRTAHRSAS